MNRRLVLSLAVLATLQACATAPGVSFTALDPVPAGKGNLYIYRKSALYAIGAKYQVAAAEQGLVGELYNASYLLLTLSPGKHRFTVAEGGFASPKSLEIDVQAGASQFVEYDSSKGMLVGWGLLSGSSARAEAQALADLKDLKRAN